MTNLKHPILREMGAIARTLHWRNDVLFKDLALQKGQFVYLTRICEHPGINQTELSHQVRVDKTTTAKAVRKLIAQGFIQRKIDKKDSRARLLYPSAKALVTYDELIAEENAAIERAFQGFSDQEIALATQFVSRMRGNIDEIWASMKGSKRGE